MADAMAAMMAIAPLVVAMTPVIAAPVVTAPVVAAPFAFVASVATLVAMMAMTFVRLGGGPRGSSQEGGGKNSRNKSLHGEVSLVC